MERFPNGLGQPQELLKLIDGRIPKMLKHLYMKYIDQGYHEIH